jgi:hypothetical protein
MENDLKETQKNPKKFYFWLVLGMIILISILLYWKMQIDRKNEMASVKKRAQVKSAETLTTPPQQLNFVAFDKKLSEIANNPPSADGLASTTTSYLWPVKTTYPNFGALLPFNRIVAYYGNLYSKGMGVLGEYPEDVMLDKLSLEVSKWQAADPNTPVIPALHYIAVVAQGGPGKDGKYRARMPDSEIDKVLAMAKKIHGIVFLDIQIGKSTVAAEVPLLEKYLKLPNVDLGIDPEFATPNSRPGVVIGTLDAADINFAANFLSQIVKQNNLPPKILIVHRFTKPMLTNYKNIHPLPEVQIVMDMDGFGSQASKLNTYKQYIYKEPVQFTGFKLFYKNDVARGPILTPEQLLKLSPIPVYIQYQ